MALRMRKKSMCRRPTSNGSVTLMNPGSHVTNRTVQAASGMWTVRRVTSGAIRVATCLVPSLFPRRTPIRRSALAEPAERRLGSRLRSWLAGRGRCWQSHQVPPGHSSWCRFRHGTQIMSPLCDAVLALRPATGGKSRTCARVSTCSPSRTGGRPEPCSGSGSSTPSRSRTGPNGPWCSPCPGEG